MVIQSFIRCSMAASLLGEESLDTSEKNTWSLAARRASLRRFTEDSQSVRTKHTRTADVYQTVVIVSKAHTHKDPNVITDDTEQICIPRN